MASGRRIPVGSSLPLFLFVESKGSSPRLYAQRGDAPKVGASPRCFCLPTPPSRVQSLFGSQFSLLVGVSRATLLIGPPQFVGVSRASQLVKIRAFFCSLSHRLPLAFSSLCPAPFPPSFPSLYYWIYWLYCPYWVYPTLCLTLFILSLLFPFIPVYPRLSATLSPLKGYLILTYSGLILGLLGVILRSSHSPIFSLLYY